MREMSKKFGGQDRAEVARKELSEIFAKPEHPLYLEKDIYLANKFNVSRLTIYSIREELGVPARTNRILNRLENINTENYTIRELALLLNLKYQNIYKIVCQNKIQVKSDIRPIDAMIEYQKTQKAKKTKKDKGV